jgi:hypothetical protein
MTTSKCNVFICRSTLILLTLTMSVKTAAAPMTESRFLTVETIIPYTVVRFEPSVEIALGEAPMSAASTPEETLRGFLASLQSGNQAVNDKLWTTESRLKLQALDGQRNRPAGYWSKVWKATFSNTTFLLRQKIIAKQFIMLQWEAVSDGKSDTDTTLLVLKAGNWYVSNEFADHPLVEGWNAPGGRVRRLADEVMK